MLPDPKLVEVVFSDALERSSIEDRAAFLEESCASDVALRQRVEALLRAHQEARQFLQALIPTPKLLTGDETLDVPRGYDGAYDTTLAPLAQTAVEEFVVPCIPGYDLLGELGRGGMGVVYKARQLDLNRIVALKMVLAGSHAGSIDLVRFHSEAEVAANLHHPNIVQVYAIGKHAGLPFLSLEYVESGTLSQRLNGVPQVPQTAAILIETLAHAVHHAHIHGIVHRDLKPSNILMTADGKPKIADFGLAKRVECGTGMTQTGAILGTPSYMAPEQAGSKKDVGPPADIYALGVLLYEMLTGRPPFQAPTPVDTIMQVLADEPVPPRRLQPKVPRDLETICLKCLQKAPAQRYASAEALANDLTRFLENRPILARPVSSLEHARRWCKRNPVVASLSAACVAGVMAAAILLSQERSKTLGNLNRAENAERDLTNQLGLTKLAEQERSEQLWNSYRDTADAKRFSHRVGQRFESIDSLAKAAQIARSLGKGEEVIADVRRKAITTLSLPDLRLEKELPGWTSEMAMYAIDPAFERYALRDKLGVVSVRRVADGREIVKLFANKSGVGRVAFGFSPDGRYLVLDSTDRQVRVWDLDRGSSLTFPTGDCTVAQSFSPDSQRIMFALNGGDFEVYGLPSGNLEQHLERTIAGCDQFAIAPDGRQFAAFFPTNGFVQFRSMESGKLLGTIAQAGNINSVSWSPDGRMLALTKRGPDSLVHLWDVPNCKKAGVLEGHKNVGIVASFNPAGNLVASDGYESMLRLWDPRSGRQLLSTSSLPTHGFTPIFNRQGDRIVLCTRTLQIWEVADGREFRSFSGDPLRRKKSPYGGSVSPDGRLLAMGSDDGTMIWDMATGAELAYLRTGTTWHVLFHTSGDLLTSSRNTGLMRWHIWSNPDQAEEYHIDQPRRLVTASTDGLVQSKDGRAVVVAVSGLGAQVIDLDRPSDLTPPFLHTGTNKCSVSPDGKWVATGCWHGTGIKVWSVDDRKETDLPVKGWAAPFFSPDGQWLATKSDAGLSLWKVGTWERGPTLPKGDPVFSPDGLHVAIVMDAVVTLIDLKSGRTLATLENPNQDRLYWTGFSPDGAQLVTAAHENFSVHVWDLRRIRAGLRAIDLDWDAPSYPAPLQATGPLKMNIASTTPTQPVISKKKAEDEYGKAVFDIFVNPFDADAHLRFGTILLKAGQLESGHAHLTAALAFDPLLAERETQVVRAGFLLSGEMFVRQHRWKEAAADFVRLSEWESQAAARYTQAAALYLISEDRDGYQRQAREMLNRFRNTNDAIEADRTAKACLITGDFQDEQETLARLTDVAVERGRNLPNMLQYFQFTRGLYEYRQGKYSSALDWFERSRKTNTLLPTPIGSLVALNGVFEAMALHKLGRSEEARRSLTTAVGVIESFGLASGAFRASWPDWLFCMVAEKEAQDLLKTKTMTDRE